MAVQFTTPRLKIYQVPTSRIGNEDALIAAIPSLLTPNVVAHLPPYFHGIANADQAQAWLDKMRSESQLFIIESQQSARTSEANATDHDSPIIGFMFIYSEQQTAHLGYLLAEPYWGQGLARELLTHLVPWAKQQHQWHSLVGGVSTDNPASSHLLTSLGFTKQPHEANADTVFYSLLLQ